MKGALREIGELEGWGVEIEDGKAYVSRSNVIDIMDNIPPGDLAEADKLACGGG